MIDAMGMLRRGLATVRASPVAPWCAVFLFVNVAVWQDGGTNPASRFAALKAMSWEHTFSIDRYKDWTVDWARTPDGHYYSNKAPGPMLLAFPLTFVLDRRAAPDPNARPSLAYKTFVSVALQAVPFAFLVVLSIEALRQRGASPTALHFAAVAMLFGNTAVLFMNSFFGHAMTAWLLLAVALAMMRAEPFFVGLFFGLALLTDYVAGVLAPALLVGLLAEREGGSRGPRLAWFLLGGFAPGLLWAWYHIACFGSPFTIALRYQNPVFLDPAVAGEGVGNMLSVLPQPGALRELLLGSARGIAPTQPWVIVAWVAAALLASRRRTSGVPASLLALGLGGLPALVWLGAAYHGWHGGWAAGPRYVSPILPLFGLLAGLVYDTLGGAGRFLLWATLLPAVALRILIYCENDILLRHLVPLWPYYLDRLIDQRFGWPWLRLLLFVLPLLGAAALVARGPARRPNARRHNARRPN